MQEDGTGSTATWRASFRLLPRKIKVFFVVTLVLFQCAIYVLLQGPMALNHSPIPPEIFHIALVVILGVDAFFTSFAIFSLPRKSLGLDYGIFIGALFAGLLFSFNTMNILKVIGEVFFLGLFMAGAMASLKAWAKKTTTPKRELSREQEGTQALFG